MRHPSQKFLKPCRTAPRRSPPNPRQHDTSPKPSVEESTAPSPTKPEPPSPVHPLPPSKHRPTRAITPYLQRRRGKLRQSERRHLFRHRHGNPDSRAPSTTRCRSKQLQLHPAAKMEIPRPPSPSKLPPPPLRSIPLAICNPKPSEVVVQNLPNSGPRLHPDARSNSQDSLRPLHRRRRRRRQRQRKPFQLRQLAD